MRDIIGKRVGKDYLALQNIVEGLKQKHPIENYGDGVSSNDDTNSTVNPLKSILKDDAVQIILGIVICVCVSYSSCNTSIYFDLTWY